MIRHSEHWRRAQLEIQDAQSQGRCRGNVVSYHDSQELPFLQACIHESLRIYGPSPFGLARMAPEAGITIGGTYFPKGTILSINPQSVHPRFSLQSYYLTLPVKLTL